MRALRYPASLSVGWSFFAGVCALGMMGLAALSAEAPGLELVEVRKIWDRAPHNAFTDLIRHQEKWFCVFREGAAHVSRDGALRVLTSLDTTNWTSAALITSTNSDLRDAKIVHAADGRLMLAGAGAFHDPKAATHQSYAWYSANGFQWSAAQPIGDPNQWLWRITWHEGAAYSVGYDTVSEGFVRLYRSRDGRRFDTVVDRLFDKERPNESSIVFPKGSNEAFCLLRRDGTPGIGLFGVAKGSEFKEWQWKEVGRKIGGPHMIQLPDGRLIAGVRLHDGKVRTALIGLDPATGNSVELLALPSGGDCSYPGLVWHDGYVWMSYYSSHEGKTCIYFAKVRVPAGPSW